MRNDRVIRVAAVLLAIGLATPAMAAETCVARAIDKVGKCNKRPFVKRIIDQQLRGVTPAPPTRPDNVDGDFLATRLAGRLATGTWAPVDIRRGEWALLIEAAQVGPPTNYSLSPIESERAGRRVALVAITADAAPHDREEQGKPIVSILSTTGIFTTGDTLLAGQPSVPKCVDPEMLAGDEFNSGDGGYPDVGYPTFGAAFRWLTISPQHKLLAMTVGRSEGYAGGGGSFAGEILLDQRDGTLVPVACYAISRYQMFGGDWNADGTRQHPESQAAWDVRPVGKGAWPNLQLKPTTEDTPSATLVWDEQARLYRAP